MAFLKKSFAEQGIDFAKSSSTEWEGYWWSSVCIIVDVWVKIVSFYVRIILFFYNVLPMYDCTIISNKFAFEWWFMFSWEFYWFKMYNWVKSNNLQIKFGFYFNS